MVRRKRRRRLKKYAVPVLVLAAVLVLFFLHSVLFSGNSREWYLILVNKSHGLSSSFEPEMIELSNGEKVDSRILDDLQEMFDTARSEGYDLFVRSGYRSYAEQKEVMADKIKAYQAEGYSKQAAEEEAKNWVAAPGHSEHQTGLCVDINARDESRMNEIYQWLAENAWEYGFILRYPADKEDITNVSYEPWHYRYVGREAAAEIQQSGLCLEEYLRGK